MIDQTVMDAAVAVLQAAYVAAGSPVLILADWPDENDFDPSAEWIVVHEAQEVDVLLGNGMRGNPSAPAMPGEEDVLYLDYFQVSISDYDATVATMHDAQLRMRAAKTVLMTLFKPPSPSVTLNGAAMFAGRVIRVQHPRNGPYNPNDAARKVRYAWSATITVRTHNH